MPVGGVVEVSFIGAMQKATDAPARDITLAARWQHESGAPEFTVPGFFDGDGHGGASGSIFKVRFSPTVPGRWKLVEVRSNAAELAHQREGDAVTATPSHLHGFWTADTESPQSRWYRRSDGSHQYVIGNTHYSFLSGYKSGHQPSDNDIAADIAANARYFKKLRFSLYGDRYPHPSEKPFLDDGGQPTDDGSFSHRPNPSWFSRRVDTAVRAAFEHDLIADLILAGPDEESSRAPLRPSHNAGDPRPYLTYIAARYGSFPNVWICLANEFNIRQPKFSEEEIARAGAAIRQTLAFPTPLSVHTVPKTLWPRKFDTLGPWNDHIILQKKLRALAPSADVIAGTIDNVGGHPRHMPVVNDELSYQGAGDKHGESDTVEAHLGALLGGGYASTGEKRGNKVGQYFWGKFDAKVHSAAGSLKFLRETVDANVTFWRMSPGVDIFPDLDPAFRALSWPDHEYLLGTDKAQANLRAVLPAGRWRVTRHDLIAQTSAVLSDDASGEFRFDAPASRAVLFHFKKAD